MRRKLIILLVMIATILVVVVVSSLLPTKTAVSFSRAETQRVQSPTGPALKVTFTVTNSAGRWVFLQVAAIETNNGSGWIADTRALPARSFDTLGRVAARETARLSVVIPPGPAPSRLRVLVSPSATTVQKGRFALSRLWANWFGQANHKELWIKNLAIPTCEVVSPEIP